MLFSSVRFLHSALATQWVTLWATLWVTLRATLRALLLTTLWVAVAAAAAQDGNQSTSIESRPTWAHMPIVLDHSLQSIAIDTHSAFWIDESGKLEAAELTEGHTKKSSSAPEFIARSSAQMHRIAGSQALWIRFEALNQDLETRWFVGIDVSSVQDVRLFWQSSGGEWMQLRSGDMLPRSQWPVLGRTPVFPLALPGGIATPVTYYLRIQNDRVPFSAPLHIYRDTALMAQRQTEYLFLGAYAGLTLLIALMSLAMAVTMKDKSFTSYTVYLLALCAFQMNFLGLSGQYIYPDAGHWAYAANFVWPPLAAAAALWFVRSVIQPAQFSNVLDKLAGFLAVALLGLALLGGLVPTHEVFQAINLLSLVGMIAVYGVIAWAWSRGGSGVRWIALGFLPVVLGALPATLRNTGLISSSFLTQYGITVGALLEMPMLMYALLVRSTDRRVARARAAGLPSQDALTGLSNTRHLLGQMQGAATRAMRFRKPYALFLIELVNHGWFAKEHGVEIGERALVVLGTRLQRIARDVDTAARLEGAQFALLAEGPCDAAFAAKLTAALAASAHRPSRLLPVGAVLKLRITCALMPDPTALEHGDDANAQLAWLLQHAEQAQRDERKLVHTVNF